MYSPRPNTNNLFLTNLEKRLINDEVLIRLLHYPPYGWDEDTQTLILDPLDSKLPNLVDVNSDLYWDIVEEKFRQGSKRMEIENVKSAVLYMFEGRERGLFGNPYVNKKEVVFKIVINEDFEVDNRISRISDRIGYLLMRESEIAGYGTIGIVGKNPREAPLGNRLQEDIYYYHVMAKPNGNVMF